MRILVTGSTTRTAHDAIRRALSRYPTGMVLITGDTPDVDALAIEIGRELGFRIHAMQKTAGDYERHPDAGWKGLNERMIAMGVDLVLAFHPDLDKPVQAHGTQHMIDLARARDIAIEAFN